MRSRAFAVFLMLLGGSGALSCVLAPRTHAAVPTRAQLIGAWRLVSIAYSDEHGGTQDPFYHTDSSGLLIYDANGWMSVQIAGTGRPALEASAARPSGSTAEEVRPKALAFDSYYAYFGTWDYDPSKSVMTHHVRDSLISGESGADYAQSIALERGRLVFTNRGGQPGARYVRRKVWERAVAD